MPAEETVGQWGALHAGQAQAPENPAVMIVAVRVAIEQLLLHTTISRNRSESSWSRWGVPLQQAGAGTSETAAADRGQPPADGSPSVENHQMESSEAHPRANSSGAPVSRQGASNHARAPRAHDQGGSDAFIPRHERIVRGKERSLTLFKLAISMEVPGKAQIREALTLLAESCGGRATAGKAAIGPATPV